MAVDKTTLIALCLNSKIICHIEYCKREAETGNPTGYAELICSVMRYRLSGRTDLIGAGFFYGKIWDCSNNTLKTTSYSEWKTKVYEGTSGDPNPLFDQLINDGDNSVRYQTYLNIYDKYESIAKVFCK